jgi:hypothetical protein
MRLMKPAAQRLKFAFQVPIIPTYPRPIPPATEPGGRGDPGVRRKLNCG